MRYRHVVLLAVFAACLLMPSQAAGVFLNPHGGVYTACSQCHVTHGAPVLPDYKLKESCYRCHGSTTSTSLEGTLAANNTQADFGDYSDQSFGSSHRNSTVSANKMDCRMCHSAHSKPAERPDLLRVQTSAGLYTMYSSITTDYGNAFCFECHGNSSVPIGLVAGAAAYSASGGDHNEAAYDSAGAHGSAVVGPNHTYQSIQCTACHNEHASKADHLLDYRMGENYSDGATLCFACHSATSTEVSVTAGYSKPFAWNDRDVSAESARASSHPTQTATSGTSLTCANCHNAHYVAAGGTGSWDTSRASDPANTKATPGSFTAFCLTCHDGSAPETTLTADAVVPYRIGFSSQTAPYFTGWSKSGFAASGHYNATTTKALCQNCHDPHGSDYRRLTAFTTPAGVSGLNTASRANTSTGMSREENLCYQCHGNETTAIGGVTSQRAADTVDVVTKSTATYGHKPAATSGVHSDTETASGLGGANRHAECADCHDPHFAQQVGGTATQDALNTSLVGGAVYGAYGAKPTYPAANWVSASSYAGEQLTSGTTDYEAYLCIKCHSSNATQPATVTRNSKTYTVTDQALEFNPSNYSFHNVTGQSTGMKSTFDVDPDDGTTTITVTWPVPTVDVFTASYGPNAMLTCTSCHTNESSATTQAAGPHGSAYEWIIDPAYPASWKTAGLSSGSANGMEFAGGADATTIICAKCHDLYGAASGEGNWSNTAHNRTAHWVSHAQPKYCTNCHIGVPHGWKRPRLIGYSDDPAPYAAVQGGTGGTTSYPLIEVEASSRSLNSGAVSWDCAHCKTSAGRHTTDISASWP